MSDIMVDMETLSTGSRAVVVSISAVRFDPHDEAVSAEGSETFYRTIKIDDCLRLGLEVDGDTICW